MTRSKKTYVSFKAYKSLESSAKKAFRKRLLTAMRAKRARSPALQRALSPAARKLRMRKRL